jgi:hypothetical protein
MVHLAYYSNMNMKINSDRSINFIRCFNVIQYSIKFYSDINAGNIN